MELHGCMACLQPWATPTSAPQLSTEQAPIRILLRGDINHWRVLPAEDLREISMSQWHEPLSIEEDWVVALFGSDSLEAPQPASSSAIAKPDQRRDDDVASEGYDPSIADNSELVPLQPPEIETEEADKMAEHPGSLQPLFDFRRVFKRLPKLVGQDERTLNDFYLAYMSATRYKIATTCAGRELKQILDALMRRWGLEVTGEELAGEASQAANTTFNLGGYSPVTMLFGILPRGFMDPEEPPQGDEVSPNESAFERALQLRQLALQASQAAILESRIARANRSRPQRLPVENFVPGTTKVEIFRDDGKPNCQSKSLSTSATSCRKLCPWHHQSGDLQR
eukprot:s1264_g15.t1